MEVSVPEDPISQLVFRYVVEGKDYPVPRLLADYEPPVIVDIGANIGGSALYFHGRFPNARIHCYEPSPEPFALLRGNVAAFPSIAIHNFGIHDKTADLPLYGGTASNVQASFVASQQTTPAFESVKVRRARDVLDELGDVRDGILKIDTEGCELPILRDLGDPPLGLKPPGPGADKPVRIRHQGGPA